MLPFHALLGVSHRRWRSLRLLSKRNGGLFQVAAKGPGKMMRHTSCEGQTHPLSEIRDTLDHMTHYALPTVFVASEFLEIGGEALRYILCTP